MKEKPDYQVAAKYVSFYGKTRSQAVSKMLPWMENNSPIWNSGEEIVIETIYSSDNTFTASAMASYKE